MGGLRFDVEISTGSIVAAVSGSYKIQVVGEILAKCRAKRVL